jgi:hypothetical protein
MSGKFEEQRTANRRLAKKRVQCFNEVLCFVSSSVLAESLVLRNPLLRQAPTRYTQLNKAIPKPIVRILTGYNFKRLTKRNML